MKEEERKVFGFFSWHRFLPFTFLFCCVILGELMWV